MSVDVVVVPTRAHKVVVRIKRARWQRFLVY